MSSNNWYSWNDRVKRLEAELQSQENMLSYTSGDNKRQCENKIANIKWELDDIKKREPKK
jgi:hypothetical protein